MKLKDRLLYYWDYKNKSQDETATNPAGITGLTKYSVNVSRHGRHIFATDGSVRNYNSSQIRDIILLFREKFLESDGYKIVVTASLQVTPILPVDIESALVGKFVKTKLDKRTKIGQLILDSLLDTNEEATNEK